MSEDSAGTKNICSCVTCSICHGSGELPVTNAPWHDYETERCDNCYRGIVEECDYCQQMREAQGDDD